MHINLFALPICGNFHHLTVRTRVVVLLLNVGRVLLKLSCPGVANILVNGVAISVELEKSRHGEVLPKGIVEIRSVEILWTVVMMRHELEFPHTFQGKVALRLRFTTRSRQFGRLESEEGRTGCLAIYAIYQGIQPRFLLVLRGAEERGSAKQGKSKFFQHRGK